MRTKSLSQAQKPVPGMLHVIETVIPGVRMIRTWQRRWLRAHLVAGVTIFAMLVPQGITYGERAGAAPSLACLQRMVLRTVMRFVVVHDE